MIKNKGYPKKRARIFYIFLLGVSCLLVGCAVNPRWSRLEKDNELVSLPTFKEEAIKIYAEEPEAFYKEHSFTYRASIEGIPAAEATFWLKRNRDRTYQARGEFSTLSPWTAVLRAVGRQEVVGQIVGRQYRPKKVEALFAMGDKKIQMVVDYGDGRKPKTTLIPPRTTAPASLTPIDPKLLQQSYDLVSTLVTLMAQYQASGVGETCKQSIITWDGFRLARITLRPNPDEADSCLGDFKRLGGFRKSLEEKYKGQTVPLYFKLDKRFPLPTVIYAEPPNIKPKLTMTEVNGTPLSYYYLPENLNKGLE